jgi:hypothetical protein
MAPLELQCKRDDGKGTGPRILEEGPEGEVYFIQEKT